MKTGDHLLAAAKSAKSANTGYRAILLLLSLVVTAGCVGGPPPKLYLLDEVSTGSAADSIDTSLLEALGISQVVLPGYANDVRIAIRGDGKQVVLSDDRRWAEEPEEAITRLLAKRLAVRATATVLVEPWPRDFAPQVRVEVILERLLKEPDGGAHLVGSIQMLSSNGRKFLRAIPFNYKVAGGSTDTDEFFSAVASGVDAIARLTVEELVAMELNT